MIRWNRAILVVWLIGARVWRRLAANRGVTANASTSFAPCPQAASVIRPRWHTLSNRAKPLPIGEALRTITVGLLFTNPTVSAIARRPRIEKLSQIRTELIAHVLRLQLIYLSKDQALAVADTMNSALRRNVRSSWSNNRPANPASSPRR